MTILSARTVGQLLASGRGRGYYPQACRVGISDETATEAIPGISDKPRSSGMAPMGGDYPRDMWVVWGHGWYSFCSGKSEAQYALQKYRMCARRDAGPGEVPPEGGGPESDLPHVGVEVECCVPNPHITRLYRLLKVVKGVGVVSDGSIRAPDGHAPVEIRICGPEGVEIERRVRLACAVLRACKAVVNVSCGLHVHIDARQAIGRSGEEVWTRLMASQRLLLAMQPKSRRENRFCRRARGKDWHYASGRRRRGRAQRYRAVNALSYRAHQTIEVRAHTGTVRAPKILAWIELLVRIARGAAGTTGVKPTKRSLESLGLSEAAMAYVLVRLGLYGPKVWHRLAGWRRPGVYSTALVAFPVREEDQEEYSGDLAAA